MSDSAALDYGKSRGYCILTSRILEMGCRLTQGIDWPAMSNLYQATREAANHAPKIDSRIFCPPDAHLTLRVPARPRSFPNAGPLLCANKLLAVYFIALQAAQIYSLLYPSCSVFYFPFNIVSSFFSPLNVGSVKEDNDLFTNAT